MNTPQLPSRRSHLRAQAQQERTSGVQWSEWIPTKVRELVFQAFERSHNAKSPDVEFELEDAIRACAIQESEVQMRRGRDRWTEVIEDEHVWDGTPSHEYVDWLQAASIVLDRWEVKWQGWDAGSEPYSYKLRFTPQRFRDAVNDIFMERRINYVFVDRSLVSRGEEPLHEEIILPVTTVISGDSRFERVESAYGEALSHLAGHRFGSSVTCAGSAVQEALRAVGASGATLGALSKNAKRRDLLKASDARVIDLLDGMIAWLNTERADTGNAHWASNADQADARLAVHLCGAFILRILATAGDLGTEDSSRKRSDEHPRQIGGHSGAEDPFED